MNRKKSCVEYYDFKLPDPMIGMSSLEVEDRYGKKVNRVVDVLTTESGETLLRVYLPPQDVTSAGDLTQNHVGHRVDVSGVVGVVFSVKHYVENSEPITDIGWEDPKIVTSVSSRSSAKMLD